MERIENNNEKENNKKKEKQVELFNHLCTYQFKRLPLLGSFVNGLFLAALLMSAAIEGIQTCFHASHSEGADGAIKSILNENPTIYPAILVGFAIVGIIMHWCSGKAHEMRELELLSTSGGSSDNSSTESLFHKAQSILNYSNNNSNRSQQKRNPTAIEELNINSIDLYEAKNKNTIQLNDNNNNDNNQDRRKLSLKTKSAESIPSNSSDNSNVSLKSLKIISNLDDNVQVISTITNNINTANNSNSNLKLFTDNSKDKKILTSSTSFAYIDDAYWAIIRYCTSPIALILCALIVYLIDHELVTEIADASLAILVVILLFSASYPPMKKAGRVLLQSAPIGIEPDLLKNEIKLLSDSIIDVDEFYVWSLTAEGNRIGTCHLVLDANKIISDGQLVSLMKEAKRLFLKNHIKCSTIQPVFIDPNKTHHEPQTQPQLTTSKQRNQLRDELC